MSLYAYGRAKREGRRIRGSFLRLKLDTHAKQNVFPSSRRGVGRLDWGSNSVFGCRRFNIKRINLHLKWQSNRRTELWPVTSGQLGYFRIFSVKKLKRGIVYEGENVVLWMRITLWWWQPWRAVVGYSDKSEMYLWNVASVMNVSNEYRTTRNKFSHIDCSKRRTNRIDELHETAVWKLCSVSVSM
jgi:hypothetical protein